MMKGPRFRCNVYWELIHRQPTQTPCQHYANKREKRGSPHENLKDLKLCCHVQASVPVATSLHNHR